MIEEEVGSDNLNDEKDDNSEFTLESYHIIEQMVVDQNINNGFPEKARR
jgi:hypothetical protein